MKVYISTGWPEGRWHTKKLVNSLLKHNFEITSHLFEADIVIAHSGGCLMLSSLKKAKLILLIDLPYWPEKTLLRSVSDKVALEDKDVYWLKKTLFHVFYGIVYIPRWISMFRNYKNFKLDDLNDIKVVLVHNEQDAFMNHKASKQLAKGHGWDYVQFPGQHDNVWENPEPYIKLIQS